MLYRYIRFLAVLLVLFGLNSVIVLGDELPFGVHFQQGATANYSDSQIDTMHSMLGFNAVHPWVDTTLLNADMPRYALHGIKSYPIAGVYPWMYTHTAYAIIQAEDANSEVRFKYKYSGAGANIIDGWYIAPPFNTATVILDSLSIAADEKYQALFPGQYIHYKPALFMKIDTAAVDTGQIVAYLKVYAGNWWGNNTLYYKDTLAFFPIYSDSFKTQNPRLYDFAGQNPDNFWWNPDFVNSSYDVMTFRLESTGICSLYVDYLKIYDADGSKLIDSSRYDAQILDYVKPSNHSWITNSVSAWYINDEPKYCNFMPVGYVNKLIMDSTQIPSTVVYNPAAAAIDFTFDQCRPYANGYSDFLKITGIQTPWIDIYPFSGGQGCNDSTLLAGTTFRQVSGCGCTWVVGLQKAFNEMTTSFDTIATEFFSLDPPRKWYDMPQAMEWKSYDCDPGGETWSRMPTQSEYSCAVFLSLCYGTSGLIDYKWDGYCSVDTVNPNNPDAGHTFGFVDPANNWQKSRLWNCQKDRVNPYIKAIDSTYLELNWERAYPVYKDSLTPPGGAFIDSISAYSNSSASNPDLGWFHVGEFDDNSNNKYILLVNRACNRGPYDTLEAPSITAIVRFNPSTIGSNYALITDLADSSYHPCDTCDWVGIPKTTYSAKMPDGTIPYTITLKAGEGKLIKIAQ